MKKRFLISIGIVGILLVALISVIGYQRSKVSYNPNDTVLITIDDKDIYLDEVMYHLTLAKMQGQLYASFMNDSDYMNSDYGDGRTIGEVMKQGALDNAIRYELLYQQAIKEGYSLTDEETEDSQKKTDSILITIPAEDQDAMNLTEDKLLVIQEKIALATRYYQDKYEEVDLTEDEAYEQMKDGHKIVIQKKVWKTVKF